MRNGAFYSLVLLVALNVDIASGVFFDPKANEKKYKSEVPLADSIPLELGEEILLQTNGVPATSVVILISEPYEKVRHELVDFLARKVGVASQGEIDIHADREKASSEANEQIGKGWPLFGDGFRALQVLGMRLDPPKEYQIISQRYNQVEKLSGYSQMKLRISDGKQLFNKDFTVIVMRRHDRSREWAAISELRIPLPFKEEVENFLVTSTEIGFLQDYVVAGGDKAKIKYFVPFPGYKDKEYWLDFMTSIQAAAKEF